MKRLLKAKVLTRSSCNSISSQNWEVSRHNKLSLSPRWNDFSKPRYWLAVVVIVLVVKVDKFRDMINFKQVWSFSCTVSLNSHVNYHWTTTQYCRHCGESSSTRQTVHFNSFLSIIWHNSHVYFYLFTATAYCCHSCLSVIWVTQGSISWWVQYVIHWIIDDCLCQH